VKSEPLGSTAAAKVRIVVWCRDCRHRVEPDLEPLKVSLTRDVAPVHRSHMLT
jgi:hypothetical protein